MTSKLVAILPASTQGSDHSLLEIINTTGLPMSTTHRLLQDLVVRRMLRRTEDGKIPGRTADAPARPRGCTDSERP